MDIEQGLYAKTVMIIQKYLKFIAKNKNNNEAKFKFQGQSARSYCQFDTDFDWIEVNFSTREPDFYKKLFLSHEDTQDTNTFKLFQVPTGNSKCVEKFKFHNDAPMLKYYQKLLNSCCFSSLSSDFVSIKKIKTANDISLRIEESLNSKVDNRIDFANTILKNEEKNQRELKVYYSLRKY